MATKAQHQHMSFIIIGTGNSNSTEVQLIHPRYYERKETLTGLKRVVTGVWNKRKRKNNSKNIKDVLSAAESEGTPFLQIEELDNPILGQKRVTPRPNAQTNGLVAEIKFDPNGFGEGSVTVR